jgi:hypothetical protein
MPLFKRKTEDTVAAVQEKLSTARSALAALEAELRERSVQAAMSEDPGAALEPMQEKVAKTRATVEALELAEGESQRLEMKRQQLAADDAEHARRRAAGQHRGAAIKAAVKVREALEQAVAGYDELVAAAERAEKRLSPTERLQLLGYGGLRGSLNDLVRTAMAQANGFRGSERAIDRMPLVAPINVPHGRHVTELPPLEDQVAAKLDLVSLLKSPGWLHAQPSDLRPPIPERGPDEPGVAKAPRVDERPEHPEVELPPEVAKGLQVIANPAAYTAEELAEAQTALAEYQ